MPGETVGPAYRSEQLLLNSSDDGELTLAFELLLENHQDASVRVSCSVVSVSLWAYGLQHASPPCPSPTSRACSNSSPSSRCHPTISSSVVPFSSCPQSFPASGAFQMSQLVTSGGQSVGVSASVSVRPANIQDWFPLWWTSWISLQSKGLSRVFSNTTVQKHGFFGAQPSLWSSSHIHTWPLSLTLTRTLTELYFLHRSMERLRSIFPQCSWAMARSEAWWWSGVLTLSEAWVKALTSPCSSPWSLSWFLGSRFEKR